MMFRIVRKTLTANANPSSTYRVKLFYVTREEHRWAYADFKEDDSGLEVFVSFLTDYVCYYNCKKLSLEVYFEEKYELLKEKFGKNYHNIYRLIDRVAPYSAILSGRYVSGFEIYFYDKCGNEFKCDWVDSE